MDAATKIAKQRLSVLELAETLGNVSEACRRCGMTRTQFYEYKRRFQTQGLGGLKNLPPIPKYHPQTTSLKVEKKILKLALRHPALGCNGLEGLLKAGGISISNVTIQKILRRHELGSRHERWLALERNYAERAFRLTKEQIAFIKKQDPYFRERYVKSSQPGELLIQDAFYVARLKGVGQIQLHAVVDTYGSYAFGLLHNPQQSAEAVKLRLCHRVVRFYNAHRLAISAVLTSNGTEFCDDAWHICGMHLIPRYIEHRYTLIRSSQTNGFMAQFRLTVLEEFFRVKLREKLYKSMEALQHDLDIWLKFYNCERPHLGDPNYGRYPYEFIAPSG